MHDVDAMNPFKGEWDEFQPESFEYGFETGGDLFGEMDGESPLDEEAAMDLAAELLSVTNEQELDQFLGSLFKKVKRAVGKVARGPIGGMLGGALKNIAKSALPGVGAALGTLIPIPGVGTALGGMAGLAASNLLGGEYGGMSGEDQEFDTAKRFVHLAGGALKKASAIADHSDPKAAAKAALAAAAKKYAPQLLKWLGEAGPVPSAPAAPFGSTQGAAGYPGMQMSQGRPGQTGRWFRRGRKIVLLGA